jgi:peptide/nickel transport system substrate-binding protein
MTESRTPEERIANFTALHEYLLTQFVFVPIYQPVESFAYNNTRLQLPATIRGTAYRTQSVMDTTLVD